jgi:hypothetical protein
MALRRCRAMAVSVWLLPLLFPLSGYLLPRRKSSGCPALPNRLYMAQMATNPLLAWLDSLLTRDRLWQYPAVLLLATLIVYGVTLAKSSRWIEPAGAAVGHDFIAFYMAGDMVHANRAADLYNVRVQEKYQQDFMRDINPRWKGTCLYLNPPHYAWLLSWLSPLGYGPALLAWWALSLTCFAAAALLWRRWLDPNDWPLLTLLAACMPAWFVALAGGQNSFFTLLILAAFCHLLMKNRDGWAGLVLSLLTCKFHLLLLPAGLLLFKGRWRALAGLATGVAATLAGTVLLLGPDILGRYFTFASRLTTLMRFEGFDTFKQHSWYAFFQLIGTGWMPPTLVSILTLAVCGATLIPLALIWRGRWDNHASRFPLQLSALLVATAVTSPHLFHYDMLILIVPAILWHAGSRGEEMAPYRPAANVIMAAMFVWLAVGPYITQILHIQISPILMGLFLIVAGRATFIRRDATAVVHTASR